ncbi:MAG: hypothetical protein ACOYWZ_17875 [Bacillota bacterium]
MFELIFSVSRTAILEVFFIAVGCILSALVFHFAKDRLKSIRQNYSTDLAIIVLLSLAGMVLPLDTYGLIPLAATLLVLGFKVYLVAPVLVSNILFNMLVPFTDAGFVLKSGMGRIMLAFIAGVLAGIMVRALKINDTLLVKKGVLERCAARSSSPRDTIRLTGVCLNIALPYILLGSASHILFSAYVFPKIMNWIFSGPIGTTIPVVFKGYDITTPIFLLGMSILGMLMNLKTFSAILLTLKVRGIIGYFVYYSVLILILALLNFII